MVFAYLSVHLKWPLIRAQRTSGIEIRNGKQSKSKDLSDEN
jgi:hypothetical protein